MLKKPKCQGPILNLRPTRNTLMNVGVLKAIYAAMAPTENKAPMVSVPPKMRRSMMQPITTLNHTALTGVLVYGLTLLYHFEPGKTPSRA